MGDGDLWRLLVTGAAVLFVVASMLAAGLGLTLAQVAAPLRRPRLVLTALAVNFLAAPALAYGIARLLDLADPLALGLVLLGTCAGAPFLPKLAQSAGGDVATAIALMFLLMVITVGFVPIVLPWLVEGVSVDAWEIAQSLIFLMLLPMLVGMLWRRRATDTATAQLWATRASNLGLLVLIIVAVGRNLGDIVDLVGTRGLLAILLFISGMLALGLLAGEPPRTSRLVLGLGSAQRNIAAAGVVAAQNFGGTQTLTYVLVAAILMVLGLLLVARRMRRWGSAGADAAVSFGA